MHFDRPLRKVPAIAVGTLSQRKSSVVGLGTISDASQPGSLRWEIGSITKVFTGILLADMVLAGELALDDPIGRLVPEEVSARLPDEARQPKLSDLAAHTSGLPGIPKEWLRRFKGSDDPYSQLTVQDVWDALGPHTVLPTKTRSRYSNFGAGLLGHLLERRAGTDYASLITDRVLQPLGLTSTGVGMGIPVQGLRKGKPTPPWAFGALGAAGALRSTVDDMLRFVSAVIDPPVGRLGEAIVLSQTPVYQGRIVGVGLGWQMRTTKPGEPRSTTVWHDGGTYGGAAFLAVDPPGRKAIVTFGNRGPRVVSPLNNASWKVFDELA